MDVRHDVQPSSWLTTPHDAAKILDELRAFAGAPAALRTIAAKVTPTLADLAAARATIAQIRREALDSRDDIIAKTAADLAAGTATRTDVHTAAAAVTTVADPNSPVKEICQAAEHQVDRQTKRALAAFGDRWITDVLRPLIDARVATIVGEVGEAGADRLVAAADHWSTWNRESEYLTRNPVIVEAFAELKRLHDIADDWRKMRIIPSTRRPAWVYRYTGDASTREQNAFTAAVVALAARAGSKPSIYTEAETVQNHGENRSTPHALAS